MIILDASLEEDAIRAVIDRATEVIRSREGNLNRVDRWGKRRFAYELDRRWENRQTQEWEEATSFFDVVCWREMAENTSESLVRGSRVIVTGRLDQRSWENAEGERRSKVEVVADEIGPSLRWATAQVTKK